MPVGYPQDGKRAAHDEHSKRRPNGMMCEPVKGQIERIHKMLPAVHPDRTAPAPLAGVAHVYARGSASIVARLRQADFGSITGDRWWSRSLEPEDILERPTGRPTAALSSLSNFDAASAPLSNVKPVGAWIS